jgi:hypothetical protein
VNRILLRAGKRPDDTTSQSTVLNNNLIANNSGNLLFADSVYKSLKRPQTKIDVNGYKTDCLEAGAINERYDAFVIPLANAFRKSFLKQLNKLTALVSKLTIPCIVVGVGSQAGLGRDLLRGDEVDQPVQKFVRAVLDRSASIGVRGEVTQAYLNKLGFKDVETIGCPSMYLFGGNLKLDKQTRYLDRNSPIAINFTRNKPTVVCDWFRRMWRGLENVTYIMQDMSDFELLYWGKIAKGIKNSDAFPSVPSHPLLVRGKARLYLDSTTWIDAMSRFSFAIGTRIHGNVAAILSGTPALVIAHDSRTLELAQFFNIPYVPVTDMHDDMHINDFYDRADYGHLVSELPAKFDNYRKFLIKNGLDPVPASDYEEYNADRPPPKDLPPPVRPLTSLPAGVLAKRIEAIQAARP